MSALYDAIKNVSCQYYSAINPASVLFGLVIEETPLKIELDQKLILTERFLTLAQHMSDYEMEFEIYGQSINAQGTCSEGGSASVVGQWESSGKIKVKNSLKNGDKVVLARMEGGEQYIVIDRIKEGE